MREIPDGPTMILTLADEIAAVRALIDYLNDTKPRDRTPKYERTIAAMNAVLYRLIAIADEGKND